MNGHLRCDPPLLAASLAASLAIGWWALPAGLALAGLVHARAVAGPRCSWYGRLHWRLPAAWRQHWALTFDDGPHPEVTPRILDILAAHQQQATFFIIARAAQSQGPLLRRICAEGHALGLHGYDHDRTFALRGPRRQAADIDQASALLADLSGRPAPRLFRPPMGLRNPWTADVLAQRGLLQVTWSHSARDGLGCSDASFLRRLRPALRPRCIALAHDGHEAAHPRDCRPLIQRLKQLLAEAPPDLQSVALQVDDQGVFMPGPPPAGLPQERSE